VAVAVLRLRERPFAVLAGGQADRSSVTLASRVPTDVAAIVLSARAPAGFAAVVPGVFVDPRITAVVAPAQPGSGALLLDVDLAAQQAG
jgi:hypothetical protein